MKILHIVPSYKPAYIYGGTIESISRLCEGLVKFNVDVTVFTTTANGKKELDVKTNSEYLVDGVKVFYFKRQTKDPSHISFLLWKRLYKECKNYDVVHIHSWWNILVIAALWICKKRKVKTIISPRGMLSNYIIDNSNSKLKQLLQNSIGKSLLNYTTFHATSEAEFNECKQLIKNWNGFMLPNIIWLPEVVIQKKENEIFTILFLSRIHPKKGIEFLIEAIGKTEIKMCLQIAGTGENDYLNELKQLAKNLNVENKIQWLGWKNREEKFNVLMNADLFALTSYNENFANVVIESLHVGTPVLISNKVGLADFVKAQNLGWICDVNVSDVQKKLQEAYYDKHKRTRINRSSNNIIQHNFSEEQLILNYINEYGMIISNGKAQSNHQYVYN